MEQAKRAALSEVLTASQVEIPSWADYRSHLDKYSIQHSRWCFRGQGNATWALAPSLERLVKGRDRERVEEIFFRRFQRQAHHFLARTPADTDLVEWFALMQHWGVPTRLLDFTLSPYVALFFALMLTDSQASHVAIWAVNYVWLQRMASGELPNKEIESLIPHWDGSPLQYRTLFDTLLLKRTDLKFVAPVQPFLMNERLAAQQGVFLCPSSLRLPFEVVFVQPQNFQSCINQAERTISSDFAQKIIVPVTIRAELLRELQRMNVSSASLFPGLEGYAKSIKESYEALEKIAPSEKAFALAALDQFGWAG